MTLNVSFENGERLFTEEHNLFRIIEKDKLFYPYKNEDGVFIYKKQVFQTLAQSVDYCKEMIEEEKSNE